MIGSKKMKFRKKNNYWYVKYATLREQGADLSSTVRHTVADEEGRCITERAVKSATAHRDELRKDRGPRIFEVNAQRPMQRP